MDPYARPAAYKFHYAVDDAHTGCALSDVSRGVPLRTTCRRLLLLVRDFSEAVPRYFEGIRNARGGGGGGDDYNETAQRARADEKERNTTEEASWDVSGADIYREMRRYLDNAAEFAAFGGPRLAVRYEDLVSGPAAAARIAAFLGPARVLPAQAEALAAEYGPLADQSRRAGGRDWLGVRRSTTGYMAGWPAAAACSLAGYFEAGLADGQTDRDMRALLEAYKPSAARLRVGCPGTSAIEEMGALSAEGASYPDRGAGATGG